MKWNTKMKQVLIETQAFKVSPVQLLEGVKAPSGNPLVEGILATAEIKNGNGRYYSKRGSKSSLQHRVIF